MKSSELENQKSREFRFETTSPSVVLASPHGLIGVHAHDFLSSSGFRFIESRQLFTELHDFEKSFLKKEFSRSRMLVSSRSFVQLLKKDI